MIISTKAVDHIEVLEMAADFVVDMMKKVVVASESSESAEQLEILRQATLSKDIKELLELEASCNCLATTAKIISAMLQTCTSEKLTKNPQLVHELVDLVVRSMEESERADGEAVAKAGPDE